MFGRKSPFEKELARRIGADRAAAIVKELRPELLNDVAQEAARSMEAKVRAAGSGIVEARSFGKQAAAAIVEVLGPELVSSSLVKKEAGRFAEVVEAISRERGTGAGPSDIAREFVVGLFRILTPQALQE